MKGVWWKTLSVHRDVLQNRQKSAEDMKGGAGINPHMNVNSGLLTPNSYGIPASIGKKSEEISLDDTEQENQSDTQEEEVKEEEDEEDEEEEEDDDDEKDYRSSTNLSLSSVDLTEEQETER